MPDDADAARAEREQRLEQLMTTATGLPTLPGVAMQIISVTNDEDSDVADIVRAVQRDPALSAKLLRVANSPIYGKKGAVESLQQAVVLMGLGATQSLVLSFSLVSSLKAQSEGALDYTLYWRRCLLSASAAKLIGSVVLPRDTEALFLASLMQDLGMLVLDKIDGELYRKMPCNQLDHIAVESYEARQFGLGHTQVGAWMAREWEFSPRMQLALEFSHFPESATVDESTAVFIRAVALSALVADLMLTGEQETQLEKLSVQAEQWLGMGREQVNNLFQNMAQIVPLFERIFDTKLLEQERLQMIADMARERLGELRQGDTASAG